jgi:glycosyltransferase involved in cell wall biosynthesis
MKETNHSTTRNVLLVDFDPGADWQFLAALREASGEEWEVRLWRTEQLHGSAVKNLLRCLQYIFYPLLFLLGRHSYRRVVGWQQFYGVSIAFWQRLFHRPKRFDLTVMTFIYKPKRGLLGKLYYHYLHYAINSPYVDRIVCYARAECRSYSQTFGVEESKFVFLPLGVHADAEPAEPTRSTTASYIFATGRSNRDYPLLLAALRLRPELRLKVACEEALSDTPDNVEVLHDCYDRDMFHCLDTAYCVAVPLRDPTISAGQLSILQAMQYGKPIIVSRSAGVQDYVVEGETALLVDATAEAWSEALARLYTEPTLYERMSQNCRRIYRENYTEATMGRNFATLLH